MDEHPVQPEQHKRTDQRHQKAGGVVRPVPSHRTAQKAPEQGPGDAEEDGDDPPARIPPRHQEFRHGPDNQPEYDPANDTHTHSSAETADVSPQKSSKAAREGYLAGTRQATLSPTVIAYWL